MASEPKWEKWRRMDCARLYQLVALLARIDPDSIRVLDDSWFGETRFLGADDQFQDFLHIARSSVLAGTLTCRADNDYGVSLYEVLMSEF